MSRALADALVKLLAQADGTPATRFTQAQRSALDALARATGLLSTRPQGRGIVYRIVNRAGLEAHLRTLRPEAIDTLSPHLPRRAANIASRRDSKAGSATHALHYLLLKAVGDDVAWYRPGGTRLDLSASTQSAGVGALAIEENDDWQSDQPLWLVENQALFDDSSWLPAGTQASLAYYAGQIPHRLVAWLAEKARVPQLILFADYDGVGLQNFVRLREQIATPCSFWLMPDWQALLRRYGSNRIWQDTQQAFMGATMRLAALDPPTELLALCAAMSREGLALEHEAVWLAGDHDSISASSPNPTGRDRRCS